MTRKDGRGGIKLPLPLPAWQKCREEGLAPAYQVEGASSPGIRANIVSKAFYIALIRTSWTLGNVPKFYVKVHLLEWIYKAGNSSLSTSFKALRLNPLREPYLLLNYRDYLKREGRRTVGREKFSPIDEFFKVELYLL